MAPHAVTQHGTEPHGTARRGTAIAQHGAARARARARHSTGTGTGEARQVLFDDQHGVVHYQMPFDVTLSTSFDLHHFPLDRQVLSIY